MSKYICARCLVSTLSLRSTTANDAYEEFLLHSWQMAKLTKPYNFQQQHVYLHPKYGSGYNGESTKSPAWHVITLGFSRYSNKNRTRMLSPHFRHVQMAENYCSQNSSIWMSHPEYSGFAFNASSHHSPCSKCSKLSVRFTYSRNSNIM